MKKGLFLAIGGITLIVAIFLIAYYSFMYFSERQPKMEINTLEIVLSDEGKVNLTEQSPIDDSQSNTIEPYKFTVKNNGETTTIYQLLIEDFVTDKNTKLLSRKHLNYELVLNDVVIKKENLSKVENNILDTKTLAPNSENNYELRIWVTGDINSTEWMGKSYNYNVTINPITN